jgi:hypothetical protein
MDDMWRTGETEPRDPLPARFMTGERLREREREDRRALRCA